MAIPDNFTSFINENTLHLNYIVGLKATSVSNNYEIDVKNSGQSLTGNIFKVTVTALGDTIISKIIVSYTIFNLKSSYFASGGGQIIYTQISNTSKYLNIHGNFSPIIYFFIGFNHLKLKNNTNFNL